MERADAERVFALVADIGGDIRGRIVSERWGWSGSSWVSRSSSLIASPSYFCGVVSIDLWCISACGACTFCLFHRSFFSSTGVVAASVPQQKPSSGGSGPDLLITYFTPLGSPNWQTPLPFWRPLPTLLLDKRELERIAYSDKIGGGEQPDAHRQRRTTPSGSDWESLEAVPVLFQSLSGLPTHSQR